jgi:uncharacterized protein YggE
VRAEELAAALGQSIGKAKLIKVDTKQNYSTSAYSSQNTGSSSNGGNTSFEIGEIEIKAWVTVSFELF